MHSKYTNDKEILLQQRNVLQDTYFILLYVLGVGKNECSARGQSHKRVYLSIWIGLNVRSTEIINCQDWLLCLEMELGDDVCREVDWGNGITAEVPQIKKICQSRQKRYSYLLFWFWFSLEYQCWRFKLETTEYETGWPKIPSLTCGCELWLAAAANASNLLLLFLRSASRVQTHLNMRDCLLMSEAKDWVVQVSELCIVMGADRLLSEVLGAGESWWRWGYLEDPECCAEGPSMILGLSKLKH